jgi:FkbM family methyltransferase
MEIKKALSTARKILLGIREYKNWREIIMALINGQEPTRVVLRNGVQINAPKNNTLLEIVHEIFFRNVYTPADLPLETNDIVVDIGANIGVFTLFAARRTQNFVYAFEPYPENVEFLNRNIHANNLHNVITHCVAVSDKIGSAKLFLSEISGGHLLFDHNIKGKLEKYVEVPTITLQRIMDDKNLEHIDFLKLDCEGSEGSILMSTPKDYLKRITKIAMEFHDNVSRLKHNDIQSLLEEVGFATRLNWDGRSPFGYLYGRRTD